MLLLIKHWLGYLLFIPIKISEGLFKFITTFLSKTRLGNYAEVAEVKRVVVHFTKIAFLTAEVIIRVDESMSVKASKELASRIQLEMKEQIDVIQVEISLDLGEEDSAAMEEPSPLPLTPSPPIDMPPFNDRGLSEYKFAIN